MQLPLRLNTAFETCRNLELAWFKATRRNLERPVKCEPAPLNVFDDLQSFTPLRYLPPKLMNWEGRAVVTDPDVFAVGDINELLELDMNGAAVMGRHRSAKEGKVSQVATSVLLMECARLRHWDAEKEFGQLSQNLAT